MTRVLGNVRSLPRPGDWTQTGYQQDIKSADINGLECAE